MIKPVTEERWKHAQWAEAVHHEQDPAGPENFKHDYETIFRYLGMEFNQHGKVIAEVGCGPYPAVSFCTDVMSVIYEPLSYDSLKDFAKSMLWHHNAYENLDPQTVDETWLFNCLQHVRDPELVVMLAKGSSSVVRFFEPIDFGVSEPHPHTFSIDDFCRWFGEANRFVGGSEPNFHTSDCAYGTWYA